MPEEYAREAVEKGTEDTLDAAEEDEVAEEEEAGFAILPGGVFFTAALVSRSFSTAFGTDPTAFASSVSDPLRAEMEIAIVVIINARMINGSLILIKPIHIYPPFPGSYVRYLSDKIIVTWQNPFLKHQKLDKSHAKYGICLQQEMDEGNAPGGIRFSVTPAGF